MKLDKQKILNEAPEGATHYRKINQGYYKLSPKNPAMMCDADGLWVESIYVGEDVKRFSINLEDLRAMPNMLFDATVNFHDYDDYFSSQKPHATTWAKPAWQEARRTLKLDPEPTENWSEEDEKRMDIIGANGPSGLHYQSKSAHDFLQAAIQHMQDRAKTYDKPQGERSMSATVAAFRAVTGIQMSEEQGWLFMALLKAVRSQQGEYKADNYEDGAAYFGLCGEAASKERVR
jgi:hypothetical protein